MVSDHLIEFRDFQGELIQSFSTQFKIKLLKVTPKGEVFVSCVLGKKQTCICSIHATFLKI